MKKIIVLMVGSKRDVKGGMTSVVDNFMNNKFSDGIKVYFVPTHISGNNIEKIVYFTFAIIRIIYMLIFKRISIIHIHVSERGSFFRKYFIFNIGKLFRKKIIIHMHGAEFKGFFERRSKVVQKHIIRFLKKADKVIVLGESWYKYINQLDNDINMIILHNSIEPKDEVIKYDHKNVNILFLAVLIKRKGIFDLIYSAKKIIDDKSLSRYNIKFVIAGEGAEREKVIEIINELKINKYFEFKGWVKGEEKEQILKNSQIFVLPSYNEGLPMGLLEAMSYGMPVVTTKVGSIEDLVKDKVNGYIINSGSVEELYERIKVLIINDKIYNKISENASKTIKDEFSNAKYFKKIENLYNELCCLNDKKTKEFQNSLFGLKIYNGSLEKLIIDLKSDIEKKNKVSIFTPNVDHIINNFNNTEVKKIYSESEYIIVDGWPVALIGKIRGLKVQRITGVDLMEGLLDLADKYKYRVFFLGATDSTLLKLETRVNEKYHNIRNIACNNGYFSNDEEVIEKINESNSDILFVGMGNPKQELWIRKNINRINSNCILAIGGAFRVISGEVSRAPKWIQKIGLEWFYRFIKEPKHLFRRYFLKYPKFIWILIKE